MEEVTWEFSLEREARVRSRAKEIIAEEMALRGISKARHVTLQQVAERLGSKQVYISCMEKRAGASSRLCG